MRFFLRRGWGLLLLLPCCSGLEHAEKEKIRQANAKREWIYRHHDEYFCKKEPPKGRVRKPYPWEEAYIGNYPKITKEFFRCKGSSLNPPLHVEGETLVDCEGAQRHSLPLREGKEHIYSILTELLNYIQVKTGKRVVITCGYRCPRHNTYADPSPLNRSSKHLLGAEVDFYVQGMEEDPEAVVELLKAFYRENSAYKGKKEYREFLRYEKKSAALSIPPWYNKEIWITLFKKEEGRDKDNTHPYPYISVQVRYDKELGEKVVYDWQTAFNGYRRY